MPDRDTREAALRLDPDIHAYQIRALARRTRELINHLPEDVRDRAERRAGVNQEQKDVYYG